MWRSAFLFDIPRFASQMNEPGPPPIPWRGWGVGDGGVRGGVPGSGWGTVLQDPNQASEILAGLGCIQWMKEANLLPPFQICALVCWEL